MKKFLLVLLSILMVFALASCQQGLTEEEAEALANQRAAEASAAAVDEAVETYKEFVRYKYILKELVCDYATKGLNSSTSQTNVSTKFDKSNREEDFYEAFYGGEKTIVNIDSSDITVTEGTASGTSKDATFKDVVFTAKKYTIYNRKDKSVVESVTSPKTLTISSGYYKVTITEDTATNTYTCKYSMGMTIDGIEYSVKYTLKRENYAWIYEDASVNGKTVDADLLIAENLIENEDFYPYQ